LGTISGAGWLTHGGMSGWRDLGHHAVAFVLRGRGLYEDENSAHVVVGPGSLIFSFPGLRHHYRPDPGTEWTEFYLIFDGPVIDLWEAQGLLNRKQPVITGITPPEVWSHRFEAVLGSSGVLATDPALVEICRLQEVLAAVLCRLSQPEDSDDSIWLQRARALLETSLHRKTPLTAVAKLMGTGDQTFREKFLRLTGLSPHRYRTIRTIDHACEMMQSSDLLDKQIAFNLGFCDEFYFSRRFKEVTGKSPREFRAQLPRSTVDGTADQAF